MFPNLFVIALVGHFAAIVQCAPLRVLGPTNASPLQQARIRDATANGHQQLLNVQNVLNQGHRVSHPHLVNAFGPHYNFQEIENNFETLRNGRIKVENAQYISPSNGAYFRGQGTTDRRTGDVSFGTAFHNSGPHTQAGTVIHEATHALLGTLDNWAPPPPHSNQHLRPYHPVPRPVPANPDVLNGYKDSPDFQHLKDTNSHNMHWNADSYRVLAHTCTFGLHAPFRRRALAESDPVKREYLIRRAAESCVRSKVTAAKAKQDSKSHADQRNAGKKVVGAKKGPLGGKHQVNEHKVPSMQGKVRAVAHHKVIAPKQAGGKKTTSHMVHQMHHN